MIDVLLNRTLSESTKSYVFVFLFDLCEATRFVDTSVRTFAIVESLPTAATTR